jgi:hypothetical protein
MRITKRRLQKSYRSLQMPGQFGERIKANLLNEV